MIHHAAILLVIVAIGGCDAPIAAQATGIGGVLAKCSTNQPGILTGDCTSGSPLTATLTVDSTKFSGTGSAGSALVYVGKAETEFFGIGADGACHYDGSTTILGVAPSANVYNLARDIACTTVTIDVGVTVNPKGFRVQASTEIVLNGKIANNGNDAVADVAGATQAATGSLNVGWAAGATGGTGVGPNGTGGSGGSGTPRGYSAATGGGNAGNGGAGVSAGGTGGVTAAVFTSQNSDLHLATAAFNWRTIAVNNSAGCTLCAGGGGAGGGNGTAKGGGGGSGGGVIVAAGPKFSGSGSIEAKGGAGGNGGSGGSGATGGGGGGKGGIIVAIRAVGSAPTTDVSGGTAGSPGNGGANSGTNGSAGLLLSFNVGVQ